MHYNAIINMIKEVFGLNRHVKKVLPDKAKKAVSYKSKNKKIAKVNSKGVITAMKKGNTKIVVSSRTNKKVKASVKVAVKAKRKPLSVPAATGTPAPVNTSTPAPVNTVTPSPISTGTAVPTPLQTAQPVFNPEYKELVSRSDLTYTGMIDHSPYGIPVGNGRFGGPVWEGNADTLSMQLNHTDTFMYNDASAQSTDESGGQVFSEECSTEITENDHYCSTAVAVSIVGREYEASIVNNKQAQISLPAENGSFTIVIGGESSMDQTVDTVGSALQNMNSSLLYDTVFESNTKWWSDFWQKSYVYLPSQKI